MTTNFEDGLSVSGVQYAGRIGVDILGQVLYDVVPAAIVANNIAASAIMNGAVTLAAGTSSTAVIRADGNTVIRLDVPRAVKITGAASGTAVTFTVVGYDVYGQKMSEAVTGPTTSTVTMKKAFKDILSITTSATTTSAFTIGTSDVLGLPVSCASANYLHAKYNAALAADAGTFVAADATSPATTTTGDIRGTYVPSAATDGSKRLTLSVTLTATQNANAATAVQVYGVTQV